MAGFYHNDIDDEDAGEENSSGVTLNTTLRPDPHKASGAFAGGPELGDANASGEEVPKKDVQQNDQNLIDPEAQTDVNTDPHWRHPILPKSDKVQP